MRLRTTLDGSLLKSLMFIHGSGSNKAVWTYQSRHFWPHHQVIALDLPGHGLSKEKPRATINEYVDYVRSVIRARSEAPPILIGHSLGGAIALRITLDTPTEVSGLVLVGTGARLEVLPELFTALGDDFDHAVALIGSYAFSPQTPKVVADKALREIKKRGPELLIGDFAAADGFDVRDVLGRIATPTLVVVGIDDRLTPVEDAEYLRDHIPNSQLRVIAEAGHMVMIEQPEVFNSVLETFISDL